MSERTQAAEILDREKPGCVEWLERSHGVSVSEHGEKVAVILGRIFRGLHNAPINHKKIPWNDEGYIEVSCACGELATHDFDGLTSLVFLAHHFGVRVAVRPNMRNLILAFHKPGSIYICKPHPTLEEAVSGFRSRNPREGSNA